MEYFDFKILDDVDYKTINNHYAHNKESKKEILHAICNNINRAISSCFQINNQYNNRILKQINTIKNTLDKTLNNLSSLFNTQLKKQSTTHTFSLWRFLKDVSCLINLFIQWFNMEEKEYYKSIIVKTLNEIIENKIILFEILENSNIKFYKFM